VFTGMTGSYLNWVAEDLVKIDNAYTALKATEGDRKEEFNGFSRSPMTSKGRAAVSDTI